MAEILSMVVLLPIALLLFAILGGVAIDQMFNVTAGQDVGNGSATVNWSTSARIIWDLTPVIVVVGIFLAFLGAVGLKISGAI